MVTPLGFEGLRKNALLTITKREGGILWHRAHRR